LLKGVSGGFFLTFFEKSFSDAFLQFAYKKEAIRSEARFL